MYLRWILRQYVHNSCEKRRDERGAREETRSKRRKGGERKERKDKKERQIEIYPKDKDIQRVSPSGGAKPLTEEGEARQLDTEI